MSKQNKTTPPQSPPPVRTGVRTRFDPETEEFLRRQAKAEGFASAQEYQRELVRREKMKHRKP